MKTLVVGMGEVGQALYSILEKKYPVHSYDLKTGPSIMPMIPETEIVHICIPWSDKFIDTVKFWQARVNAKYFVVHSSVPVGTCEKLGVYHSPVRGKHPDMEIGLRTYVKYVSHDTDCFGGLAAVCSYFQDAGIKAVPVIPTKTTELMKLLELCRYGVYIAFAKEQERICQHFGVNYHGAVTPYEETRNEGLVALGMEELRQPILYPFESFVGGHCTVEDMEIMLRQVNAPLLWEAYKIDKATVVWGNCNIYPTAKIGKGCSIGQFCEIGNNVVIGDGVRIGAFVFIPEGVSIESDVFIAPRVSFSNDKHPPSGKENWGHIVVKKGAVIGMGAIILPGVTIGEGAVVGAGSVVTKDVEAGKVVYGTAAYPHGTRADIYEEVLSH